MHVLPWESSLFLAQFGVEPVFGWGPTLIITALLALSLLLTLTDSNLSIRGRAALAALRLLAMVVFLLAWIRPGFISEEILDTPGSVAVLLDNSESMSLPSGGSDQDRWQVQRQVWEEIARQTNLKVGQTKIVPYFYGGKVAKVDGESLPSLNKELSSDPASKLTDLGAALKQVAQMQVDPPLRGVVLVGDMTQTVIPAASDPAVIARQMAQLDQSIMVVGIGAESKTGLRDVAIEQMPAEITAFAEKEVRVPMVIAASGVLNQPIEVELFMQADGEAPRRIGRKEVRAGKAEDKLPIDFDIVLPNVGDYLLTAKASIDGREQIPTNNESIGFVTVREGGVRLLFIEGAVRWEFTYLRRSLDESLEFEIDVPTEALSRARDGSEGALDLRRSYDFKQYDAFIIGDIPAALLSRSTQQEILRRVERSGAGILFMGGAQAFIGGGYESSEFAKVMPVQLPRGRQAAYAPLDRRFHIFGEQKLSPTRPHEITRLDRNAPDNDLLWDSLPAMIQMNRLGRPKAGAGATVLLENQSGDPALITSLAGRGRVALFAPDTTYQWRFKGFKQAHQRFWRQMLLWLVKKNSLEEGFELSMDRRRLNLEAGATIDVQWIGGTSGTEMPSDVKFSLYRDGKWFRDVPAVESGKDAMQVTINRLAEPGVYKLKLQSPGSGGKHDSEIAFVVQDQSVELVRPSMDIQMARSIAAANSKVGGRLVRPEEIDVVIEWLREKDESATTTVVQRRALGDQAWDSWIVLALFCFLLCFEWTLRKRWQLP
jgi:uncharacterized membrane protein